MNRTEALTEVLRDPTRSAKDRDIAARALQIESAATDATLTELLQTTGKPLERITYHDAHAFCSARGWSPQSRELFDRWLFDGYFKTDRGRKDVERAARYLVDADMNEWGYALEVWKDSGFKDCGKLVGVLERIADASCHVPESVEHARQFLTELRRRTAP